jgi:hypothetical protein
MFTVCGGVAGAGEEAGAKEPEADGEEMVGAGETSAGAAAGAKESVGVGAGVD